jgi:hypothetical protein
VRETFCERNSSLDREIILGRFSGLPMLVVDKELLEASFQMLYWLYALRSLEWLYYTLKAGSLGSFGFCIRLETTIFC